MGVREEVGDCGREERSELAREKRRVVVVDNEERETKDVHLALKLSALPKIPMFRSIILIP